MKSIPYEEDRIADKIAEDLGDTTVAFVKPKRDKNGSVIDVLLAGSGVFVTVGEIKGILTADHVLENIRNEDTISLVFPYRIESLRKYPRKFIDIQKNLIQFLTIKRGVTESKGPDLGFLGLPSVYTRTLELKGLLFYDLIKRQKQMLDYPALAEKECEGNWLISGMADEWTKEIQIEDDFLRCKQFKGISGMGKEPTEFIVGDYDFLDFETLYGYHPKQLKSYGGFSGGGLWQIFVDKTEKGFETGEKLLWGVIFYQSDREKDGFRIIRCNGRYSIYKHAIEKIRKMRPLG